MPLANQRILDEIFSHVYSVNNEQWNCLPLFPRCKQSIPSRVFFSLTCRDLTDARVSIGDNPEFSANAIGTTSNALANARIAYCSIPGVFKLANQETVMEPCLPLPLQLASTQFQRRLPRRQLDCPSLGFGRHTTNRVRPVLPRLQSNKLNGRCRRMPTILLLPRTNTVTARVFAHSSITSILSRVVPNSNSRTIPACPSFSDDRSSNLGTMRPFVAIAIN